ncbi:MAG: hypothetical protein QXG83_01130, partial [Candidatus Pacearchaeota archaeon]
MKNKIFAIMLLIILSLFILISVASALKVELKITDRSGKEISPTDNTYTLSPGGYIVNCIVSGGSAGKKCLINFKYSFIKRNGNVFNKLYWISDVIEFLSSFSLLRS